MPPLPALPALPCPQVRLVHEELFQAYPDYELHVLDNLVAQGNQPTVALHWTATGEGVGGKVSWRGRQGPSPGRQPGRRL